MAEVKGTITSNISNALRSKDNQQTPAELKQSGLLTSISKQMKLMVKQGRQQIRTARQKDTFKLFSKTNKLLEIIKKNTKQKSEKGFSLLKYLLLYFVVAIVKTVKIFGKAIRMFATTMVWFGKQIKNLGVILKGWAKGLFKPFKESKIGQTIIFAQRKLWKSISKMFNARMLQIQKIFNVNIGRMVKAIDKITKPIKSLGLLLTKLTKPVKMYIKMLMLSTQLYVASSKKLSFLIGKVGGLVKVFGKLGGFIALSIKNMGNFIKKLKLLSVLLYKGVKIPTSILKSNKTAVMFAKGIANLANFFKNIKVPSFGGIFKTIGNMFKGVGNIFKPLLKFKGTLKPILNIGLKWLAPLFAIFDGIKGFLSATEWFDKKKGEDVTIKERISAIIGSILSGFTLGIFGSGKEMAHMMHKLFTSPMDFIKNDLPDIMKKGGERLISGLKKLGGWILKGFKFLINFLGSVDWVGIFQSLTKIVNSAFQKGIDLFKTYFPIVIGKIIDVFKSINWVGVGKTVMGLLKTYIGYIAETLWIVLKNLPSVIWTLVSGLVPLLWEVVKGIAGIVWGGLKELMPTVMGAVSGLFGLIWEGWKWIGNKIYATFMGIFNWLKGFLSEGFVGAIVNIKDAIFEKVKSGFDFTKNIGNAIMDNIKGFWTWIKSKIKNIFSFGKTLFGDDKTVTTTKLDIEDKPIEELNTKELKARTKEIKNVQEEGGIVLDKTLTNDEQKGMFMTFLLNEFSDAMASKIGAVINDKKPPSSINVPIVKVM